MSAPLVTPEERTRMRERLAAASYPGRTHWQGCTEVHLDCMALRLLDALEAAERERDEAYAACAALGWRTPADRAAEPEGAA